MLVDQFHETETKPCDVIWRRLYKPIMYNNGLRLAH